MFVFQENLNSVICYEEDKPIQEVLSFLILLADRVIIAAQEAESFKTGNLGISAQVTDISLLLRPLARLTTSTAVYDRPIRRVCLDLTKALDRALTFSRRCRHERTNFIHHILSINTAADFKKASNSLDSSLADLQWLVSIYNRESFDLGTMPPLACTDPILAYVWPAIAALHMGRVEGAQQLADFANNVNERTKNVIVEEIGIPPLLKMVSESASVDAQIAAATALCNLGDDCYRVTAVREAGGVKAIVKAMEKAPPSPLSIRVQLILVELVVKILEIDDSVSVKEEFGAAKVTTFLVALLGLDVDLDEFLVDLSYPKIMMIASTSSEGECSRSRSEERVAVPLEVKLRAKVKCAIALWKLARGSLLNCQNITKTKALLVLAKIIKKEKEHAELKKNCLKVVMELASMAESHSDLKRSAFKLSSTPTKVILDQLMKVMDEERNPLLVIPAVKAIGCLASLFPAKEKRFVRCLVAQLSHWDRSVADEGARALNKFVCGENYNRKEHSEAIIELNGVAMLMKLLRNDVRGHVLVLLSNIVINASNVRVVEEARVLCALEGTVAKRLVSEHPELRQVFAKAVHQLVIYQVGIHPPIHDQDHARR